MPEFFNTLHDHGVYYSSAMVHNRKDSIMKWTIELLMDKTYEQAEQLYFNGCIGQELWEKYCYVWRNSAPRLSSLAEQYQD